MDVSLKFVKEFHDAFEVKTPTKPVIPEHSEEIEEWVGDFAEQMEKLAKNLHNAAEIKNKNLLMLRLQLIQEELAELARGLANNDKKETFDALIDLRYVLDGTILCLGFGDIFMQGFSEVHRSNMSKLENGKPLKNNAGRVVKGSNYTPPDLDKILQN